jgi:hypothetical protein
MTSQRDETVGHVADDEMTDDPIVIERHDEIVGGPPADDPGAEDVSARGPVADDSTPAGYQAGDELATGRPADGELAGDELAGRHATPETGSAGLDQDPPPLVIPSDAAPGDPAAPSWAATPGTQAAVPEPGAAVTPDAIPADAASAATSPADAAPVATSPADATPAATSPVDASAPAASVSEPAGPNGDGIPAAALAEQQWPAIQAMFVDDPKGSVERAAAAADEVAKAFVASLQREQTELRAAWEKDTNTEDLRTALQQYRAFCGRLEGLA